jgi:GH15 family glucan-1,4-alpha-glucosidase
MSSQQNPTCPSAVPQRVDGYAPLRDYAAIGDGRTVALVARDGAIDWLPLPNIDSPAVFAAILDRGRGGSFLLQPELPFSVARRYLPGTNVLETTFHTERGAVKVSDALTLPDGRLEPFRELQRRIDGLSGRVSLRWQLEPRFDYAQATPHFGKRAGFPAASSGSDAIGLVSFGAGEAEQAPGGWKGRFMVEAGQSALLALSFAHQEPLVFPTSAELDSRFRHTCETWQQWSERRTYTGPWQEMVIRSALALKLLVFAPTGAISAAATTSLPELIGGERNWDYRYSWLRDSAFTIDAFLRLGCPAEAQAYFWWLMHATQLTAPRLHVLHRLDGGTRTPEHVLPLAGYRGSRPVRIGNGAAEQLQLDTYGELLQTAWLYASAGNRIDRDVGRRLASLADFVCANWRRPDSGIWEGRGEPMHFTQSKMMCAVALDRATALAERQLVPKRHLARWRSEAAAIRAFVDAHCWSDEKRSYLRAAGSDDLDASVLLAALYRYANPGDARLRSTIDAISRELRAGPLVRRYSGDDGLPGSEGAFLACSFWLVEALARNGDREQASELMSDLVRLANDVGLYSEEIEAGSDAFLGNMPQGLSHLALISAAAALAEDER